MDKLLDFMFYIILVFWTTVTFLLTVGLVLAIIIASIHDLIIYLFL